MADKRYIITADTGQAVRNVKKFADILNNVSELPENFQKNMYNALNKAQKEIVKFGSDTKKLGVVFSSLSQTIQKNLDFLNKDMLPKEVVTRFKDLEKSLTVVATNMEIVSKASSKVEKDTGSLVNKISQYSAKLNSIANSAGIMQSELNKTANAILNTNKSVITSSKGLKTISGDYQQFSDNANRLSQELINVTKYMYSLSVSEEKAKSNLKALRVNAAMLGENMKGLQALRLNIENTEKIKSQLQSISDKIKTNENLMNSNKKAMADLQNQYTSATNKISILSNTYDELGKKMQAVRSRGGSISSQLAKDFQNTGNSLTAMKTQTNEIQKSINSLNSIQRSLIRSTQDLINTYNRVKKMDVIDENQLTLMKKQVDLLDRQGIAAKKALTDVREYNVEMATLYEQAKSENLKKLQASISDVTDSAKIMTQNFNLLNTEIAETNKNNRALEASLKASYKSAIRLSQSAISASDKTKAFNTDLAYMNITAKELDNRLDRVINQFNRLDKKPSKATINTEIIKGGMAEVGEVSKIVNELLSEIRNIDTAKQKLKEMKDRYYENIAVIKQNRVAVNELQKQYDKNNQTLNILNDEYDKLKTRLSEIKNAGGKSTPELTNYMQQLKNAIKETNSSLNETEKKILALKKQQVDLRGINNALYTNIKSAQQKDTVSDIEATKLRETIIALQGKVRATNQLGQEAKTLNNVMSKQHGVLRLVGTQFRSLIYDLNAVRIAFILLASSTGIGATLRVIADFDKSMARIRALMIGAGEATATLNVEYKALQDTVMALGATTKFTAGQVAEGAIIITQAGYEARQSIEILKPTLDLAVAGQIEMSEAANILTKTIAMFQKQAEDATKIADIYAATINYSQTNMTELATAMSYVGPVAESFGLTLEETAAYLAVLANNGITASKAGTSLRQLMLNIKQPTSKAQQVLDAYGLSLDNLQKQGMTAAEALNHIITTLAEAGKLGRVVRVTALPSAEILGKSNEQLDLMLSKLLQVYGYVDKVAKNSMDQLHDQFIQLVSALHDTVIKFGIFTGGTDALTDTLRNSADALRAWNTDMADLLTDLGLAGGVLLAARGRWKSYQQAVKDAKNGQVTYTSIVDKTEKAFTNFKGKITQVNDSIFKYRQSMQGATLATKALGVATKLASMPIIAMSVEMLALSAAMYGISKAAEYFMKSNNNISDVLENNRDLFKAAAQGGNEYKRALAAIAANVKNMNDIQRLGNIEKINQEIEQTTNSLIDSVEKVMKELSVMQNKVILNKITMQNEGYEFFNFTEEQYDIIAEVTKTQLPILDNLLGAVKSGNSEEIASIMADINPDAMKTLGESLGIKDLYSQVMNIDTYSNALQTLIDKKAVFEKIVNNQAIKTFNRDFKDLINTLDLVKNLSQTDLSEVFSVTMDKMNKELPSLEKFIPIESYKKFYDELLNIADGGKELAKLLNWSENTGFFFNKGDLEQEIYLLKEELVTIQQARDYYNELIKTKKGNVDENTQRVKELEKEANTLNKIINLMSSYGDSLQEINNIANRSNLLKIWEEAANRVEKFKTDEIAESLVKINELSEDFGKNFTKNIGTDFLKAMNKMELLKPGDLELAPYIEDIKIAGQSIDEYITAMEKVIALKLQDKNITEEQQKDMIAYLKTFKELIRLSYIQTQDKQRNKRKRKDDDLYLIYLQSEAAIDKATDAITKLNEEELKRYEINRRIIDIQERHKPTEKGYKLAMKSLNEQREVISEQIKAMADYEKQRKSLSDVGKLWGAMEIDNSMLQVGNQYISMLEKKRALETAINNDLLQKNPEILDDLYKQYKMEKELYDIQNKRYILTRQSQIADIQKENNQMKSGGWLQVQRDWAFVQNKFNAEIEMVNQQIMEVANKITELASQTDLDVLASGELERLNLLRQELELRKENLELQKQMNNPSGYEGAKQAFREYAQSVGNDAALVKESVTQALDSISSNLTEGLYAAMKKTEFNWEQLWDNMAKIFLQKALEMTVMRGMSAAFNAIFGAIGGAIGGGLNSPSAFGGGGIAFAAKGRVINSPTYFNDKGKTVMAGERGAEAIMPLTRLSNGDLGIKSQGNSGAVNHNDFSIHITTTGSSGNQEQDRKQAEELQKMIKMLLPDQIGKFIKKEHRQGGMFYGRK